MKKMKNLIRQTEVENITPSSSSVAPGLAINTGSLGIWSFDDHTIVLLFLMSTLVICKKFTILQDF